MSDLSNKSIWGLIDDLLAACARTQYERARGEALADILLSPYKVNPPRLSLETFQVKEQAPEPQTLVDRVCDYMDRQPAQKLFQDQKFYERDANRLFPQGCTCVDRSGDCDWCAVYYDGPAEFEGFDDPALDYRPGGNFNHSRG